MKNKNNVINWANDKGLIKPENSFKQFIKTIEEIGEVANALNKDNREALIDGIGDVVVTLIILAKQNNLEIGRAHV